MSHLKRQIILKLECDFFLSSILWSISLLFEVDFHTKYEDTYKVASSNNSKCFSCDTNQYLYFLYVSTNCMQILGRVFQQKPQQENGIEFGFKHEHILSLISLSFELNTK